MKSFARSNVQMKFNIDEKKGVKISGGKTQLLLVLQLHLIPHHFAGQGKRKASERERGRAAKMRIELYTNPLRIADAPSAPRATCFRRLFPSPSPSAAA